LQPLITALLPSDQNDRAPPSLFILNRN